MTESPYCPRCGSARPVGASFCPTCGHEFASVAADVEPPTRRTYSFERIAELVLVVMIVGAIGVTAIVLSGSQGTGSGEPPETARPTQAATPSLPVAAISTTSYTMPPFSLPPLLSEDHRRFVEFNSHTLEANLKVAGLLLTAGTVATNPAAMLPPNLELQAFFKSERAWLDANPPAPCYQTVWDWQAKSIDLNLESSRLTIKWLKAFPKGSDSDWDKLVLLSDQATAAMAKAADLLSSVDCD